MKVKEAKLLKVGDLVSVNDRQGRIVSTPETRKAVKGTLFQVEYVSSKRKVYKSPRQIKNLTVR